MSTVSNALRIDRQTDSSVRSSAMLVASGALAVLLGVWGYSLGTAGELSAGGFGTNSDADSDGLSDVLEEIIGTSSIESDSDYDGFFDAEEIARHSDPRESSSYPASNTLSVGQVAYVFAGELRLQTLIYLPAAPTDWNMLDLRLGLRTQLGPMEFTPDVFVPFSTLTTFPTSQPGSLGLRIESRVPVSIFEGIGPFAFVATITDEPIGQPKSAAAVNLDFVAGVLSAIEMTDTSVVAPRGLGASSGSGPLVSTRPIVVSDEIPSAFTYGEICLQSTTEVGFVGGVIELLVESSSCEPADAYCSPTCAFEAGTTKELVDPLALIGG